jgi:dolichol-phosphate mannosyltransferase
MTRENPIPKSAGAELKLLPTPTGELRLSACNDSGCPTKFALVLPTLNEARNIESMILGVTEVLERAAIPYELIVVDDNSSDGTWRLALDLCDSLPRLRVIRRTLERGLATAVIRGWQASSGDVLGVIDADLQHPPDLLPKLWDRMQSGADLAVASRRIQGGGVSDWSWRRRLISRTAEFIGGIILPEVFTRLSDPMSGYLLVRRNTLKGVTLDPRGYKILVEILARGKITQIAEVGYVFRERGGNESKIDWRTCRDYLLHLSILRFR